MGVKGYSRGELQELLSYCGRRDNRAEMLMGYVPSLNRAAAKALLEEFDAEREKNLQQTIRNREA